MYIVELYIKSFFIVFVIFWCLFYGAGFYVKRKANKDRKINYECGFLPFNNVNFSLNITFFLSAASVLMYELELLILLPAMMNKIMIGPIQMFLVFFFLFLIVFTVFIDSQFKIIKWVY